MPLRAAVQQLCVGVFAFKPVTCECAQGKSACFPARAAAGCYCNPHNTGKHDLLIRCMTQQCRKRVCVIKQFDFNSVFTELHFTSPAWSTARTVACSNKVARRFGSGSRLIRTVIKAVIKQTDSADLNISSFTCFSNERKRKQNRATDQFLPVC